MRKPRNHRRTPRDGKRNGNCACGAAARSAPPANVMDLAGRPALRRRVRPPVLESEWMPTGARRNQRIVRATPSRYCDASGARQAAVTAAEFARCMTIRREAPSPSNRICVAFGVMKRSFDTHTRVSHAGRRPPRYRRRPSSKRSARTRRHRWVRCAPVRPVRWVSPSRSSDRSARRTAAECRSWGTRAQDSSSQGPGRTQDCQVLSSQATTVQRRRQGFPLEGRARQASVVSH